MRKIALFAGLILAGANAFAVDSQLLNLVMPDAQVMAGLNVTTAKISPFGQYLLAQIGAKDAGLQEFINTTGFDPRQDVTEILAASVGAPSSPGNAAPGGLMLVKGTFDVTKIVAAAQAKGKVPVETYAGATLLSGGDGKQTHGIAFIGSTVAVAGDLASVKAALDRASGVNSINPALAARVQTLSSTQDAWSVSLASLSALIPGAAAQAAGPGADALQYIKDIQSSSGGVKFGANIAIVGQAVTTDGQNAKALGDLVRMLASLAQMGAASNPQAAPIAQVLQTLQVSTDGNAVNLSLSVPESQVESLIQSASAKKPAGAARKL